MAGRQLPFVSILVPFWLVVTFVKMEGGTWKQAFEVWPATHRARARHSRSMQWLASDSESLHLMTDVVSGVFSVDLHWRLFLRFVWHPKTPLPAASERAREAGAGRAKGTSTATADGQDWKYRYTATETIYAWLPWVILIACCAIWGMPEFKTMLNNLFATSSSPRRCSDRRSAARCRCRSGNAGLHNLVQRMPPVAPLNAKPGGGAVHDQLAVGCRHRRVRRRRSSRALPEAERRRSGRRPSLGPCTA